jgi:hypothetical protein
VGERREISRPDQGPCPNLRFRLAENLGPCAYSHEGEGNLVPIFHSKGSGFRLARGASLLEGLCLHNLGVSSDPQQETTGTFGRLEAAHARQHRSFHHHFEVRTHKDPNFLKRALQGLRGFVFNLARSIYRSARFTSVFNDNTIEGPRAAVAGQVEQWSTSSHGQHG